VTILLLRHGETAWNREPARCLGWAEVHHNDSGRDQAREQARALAGRGLELIVSSHLARARETAEIVRAHLDGELPMVLDPRLAETHRGEWETRLFSEIMLEEPEAWQHYRDHPESFRFPGGESLADQQRRVLASLRDVARDGRRALLVTHGGSIRLTRCFLDGRGVAAFHETKTVNGVADEIAAEGLEARIGAFLDGRRGAA
jgi:broad specificity phosphatase PhoE